jgi:hypothetical protein
MMVSTEREEREGGERDVDYKRGGGRVGSPKLDCFSQRRMNPGRERTRRGEEEEK